MVQPWFSLVQLGQASCSCTMCSKMWAPPMWVPAWFSLGSPGFITVRAYFLARFEARGSPSLVGSSLAQLGAARATKCLAWVPAWLSWPQPGPARASRPESTTPANTLTPLPGGFQLGSALVQLGSARPSLIFLPDVQQNGAPPMWAPAWFSLGSLGFITVRAYFLARFEARGSPSLVGPS